jgi:hypothetical protein
MLNVHRTMLLAAAVSVSISSASLAADRNATGLPTYPHESDGKMDATYRSIPNGQSCISYSSESSDALADVEAWFKTQMPRARVEDITTRILGTAHSSSTASSCWSATTS